MQEEVKKELEEMGSQLAGAGIGLPYGGQEDYFARMPGKIVALITAERREGLLPVTANPYAVPSGYFEQLPGKVATKAIGQVRKGVVVSFRQLRVAAAAVVLLAVGLGTFVRMGDGPVGGADSAILANVADKDIKAYLGNAGASLAGGSAGRYIDKIDIKAEDIEKYLDENGWETDMTF